VKVAYLNKKFIKVLLAIRREAEGVHDEKGKVFNMQGRKIFSVKEYIHSPNLSPHVTEE
jgi:hypothetical protein